ncbi:MAG: hypothetical protein KBC00_03995, partial [Candidatus Levybacteria bacterium]|nr:hypothetical protein [Candidatus Levybacteria bacterium]
MPTRSTKFRLIFVLGFFAGLYLLVLFRLFYWQVARADELKTIGENQSSDRITINATRGEILASDSFPLATNKISYLLYANPKVVNSADEYARTLSPVLSIEESSIAAKLKQNLFWVRIAQKLPDTKKQEVENLNLAGLGFYEQSERYYPEASMAAQLIGFLGIDKSGENKGFFGLEGYYNDQLSGRDGSLYVVKDALGHPVVNDIREEKK